MFELLAGLVLGWWVRVYYVERGVSVSLSQPCSFCGSSAPLNGRQFLASLYTPLHVCTSPACKKKLQKATAEASSGKRPKKKA